MSAVVNPYSLGAYYVEILALGNKISNATAFFTKRNEQLYLVTNWHVVSGKNSDTGELLNTKGAAPDELRVYLPQRIADSGEVIFDDSFLTVILVDEDFNKLWLETKIDGKVCDVALIPIDEVKAPYIINTIEDCEEPFSEQVRFEIASTVYVIGFPFGKIGGQIPIWKRASVATEPDYEFANMPYYLVDTATRAGMSGSPVILYEKRPTILADQASNRVSLHWTKFEGIYSGRIGADNESDAQLGRVWKPSVIDLILSDNGI